MRDNTSVAHCPETAFEVVVIVASMGGLRTIGEILSHLPGDFSAPILVVQHTRYYGGDIAALLGRRTQLEVKLATHGQQLRAGTVYVAPAERHLLVVPPDVGTLSGARCGLSAGPRENFSRPAGDPLFRSAAECFGARTLGVVLTGRLNDGAAGALAIHHAGGVVIAQDPTTCVASGMPLAAIGYGCVDLVLPPDKIVCALVSLVMVPGVRALFGFEAAA
jgi:two-component system chemotaxis response regulator CheB